VGRVIKAITANLGCGGPHSAERTDAAYLWRDEVIIGGTYDVLFLQEVPRDRWVAGIDDYYAIFRWEPAYRPLSILGVRKSLGLKPKLLPGRELSDYHGSYLAAATIELAPVGRVALVSVHASPTRAEHYLEKDRYGGRPDGRPTGNGALWDSDVVLETLRRIQRSHPLIAAGDFNEARKWDDHYPGCWGAEYFRLS
jgi:hypothetical protein